MAAATEKATPCCIGDAKPALARQASNVLQDWSAAGSDPSQDQISKRATVATLMHSVDSLPQPAANPTATKGIYIYIYVCVCVCVCVFLLSILILDDYCIFFFSVLLMRKPGARNGRLNCLVLFFFFLLVSKKNEETELHRTK